VLRGGKPALVFPFGGQITVQMAWSRGKTGKKTCFMGRSKRKLKKGLVPRMPVFLICKKELMHEYRGCVYMKSIHVPIIIETDEDGIFIVSCPQFKGCHTYGKTIDEALIRIREVIELCLEDSQTSNPLNTFVGFREVEIVPGA